MLPTFACNKPKHPSALSMMGLMMGIENPIRILHKIITLPTNRIVVANKIHIKSWLNDQIICLKVCAQSATQRGSEQKFEERGGQAANHWCSVILYQNLPRILPNRGPGAQAGSVFRVTNQISKHFPQRKVEFLSRLTSRRRLFIIRLLAKPEHDSCSGLKAKRKFAAWTQKMSVAHEFAANPP